jgi:hypothetical protein
MSILPFVYLNTFYVPIYKIELVVASLAQLLKISHFSTEVNVEFRSLHLFILKVEFLTTKLSDRKMKMKRNSPIKKLGF